MSWAQPGILIPASCTLVIYLTYMVSESRDLSLKRFVFSAAFWSALWPVLSLLLINAWWKSSWASVAGVHKISVSVSPCWHRTTSTTILLVLQKEQTNADYNAFFCRCRGSILASSLRIDIELGLRRYCVSEWFLLPTLYLPVIQIAHNRYSTVIYLLCGMLDFYLWIDKPRIYRDFHMSVDQCISG